MENRSWFSMAYFKHSFWISGIALGVSSDDSSFRKSIVHNRYNYFMTSPFGLEPSFLCLEAASLEVEHSQTTHYSLHALDEFFVCRIFCEVVLPILIILEFHDEAVCVWSLFRRTATSAPQVFSKARSRQLDRSRAMG